jgi:serine/threonine protein kinase
MLSPNTILQGRYRIIRQLGRGGMGAVYEALDERVSSIVALKETFAETEAQREAFEQEAKRLANLDHDAFPKVMDHFEEGDGQYLVMELISGDDLAKLLRDRESPFALAKVLEWADQLLDALDVLHSYPIIHRDIKPSNLKLTKRGKIKLLDFGIAKGAAGQMTTLKTDRSGGGYTPHYAPLEQILRASELWSENLSIIDAGAVERIREKTTDPRSDLYALAATLYHLMTGVIPPDAPTRALSVWTNKPDRLRPAHELNPQVLPTVSVVLMQAMALERCERPHTAKELHQMLHVAVNNPSPSPELSPELEEQARQSREAEAHRRAEEEAQTRKLIEEAHQREAEKARQEGKTARHAAEQPTAFQRYRRSWLALGLTMLLLVSIAVLVRYKFFSRATSVGDNSTNNQITGTPTPSSTISPVKNIKATPSTLKLKQELKGHTAIIWAVAFSLDGSLLASASADGAIILWNTETWEHKEPLRGHKGDVYSLSFSPDGQTLASAGKDKTIKLWNTRTGQLAPVQLPDEHKDEVWRVAFSPDGKLLASADKDKTFRLWDVSNGWMSRPLLEHTDVVLALAFAPDGSTLASTGFDGRLLLWDVRGGVKPEELKKYARALYSVAFSPDGKYLVCAGEDGSIKRWSRQSQSGKWEEVEPLERHTDWVLSLAVSPDSKLLVSVGKDDKILLWDLQAGASKPLNERVTGTRAIAFSPDGQTLVSGGEDTIVRVWQ